MRLGGARHRVYLRADAARSLRWACGRGECGASRAGNGVCDHPSPLAARRARRRRPAGRSARSPGLCGGARRDKRSDGRQCSGRSATGDVAQAWAERRGVGDGGRAMGGDPRACAHRQPTAARLQWAPTTAQYATCDPLGAQLGGFRLTGGGGSGGGGGSAQGGAAWQPCISQVRGARARPCPWEDGRVWLHDPRGCKPRRRPTRRTSDRTHPLLLLPPPV